MGLAGHGPPDVDFGIDWDGIETVVDVGGGTGALLTGCSKAPPSRATLVDLPGTVERAHGPFEKRGQSFFDPLPHADLYILKSILNDWPDEETDAILANVARAQHARGRDRRRRARRRAAPPGHRDGPARRRGRTR